jgi:hypothetical protein
MNCRECENQMVEALYGELEAEARGRFDAHLEECPVCRRLFAGLQSTLEVLDRRERRDPGQAYWDGYWNRLGARMEAERDARRRRGWLGRLLPGLSPAALKWAQRGVLAALLVVFGAVAGRILIPGPAPQEQLVTGEPGGPGAPPGRRATAEACARRYIEDSQVLLLALVNFDPETEGEYLSDWSAEKKRSRELASQGASLRSDLTGPRQRRLRDLVTELELIMIQIANLESAGDLEAVELIRSTVSQQDMMLRINLERMRGADEAEPKPGECGA